MHSLLVFILLSVIDTLDMASGGGLSTELLEHSLDACSGDVETAIKYLRGDSPIGYWERSEDRILKAFVLDMLADNSPRSL